MTQVPEARDLRHSPPGDGGRGAGGSGCSGDEDRDLLQPARALGEGPHPDVGLHVAVLVGGAAGDEVPAGLGVPLVEPLAPVVVGHLRAELGGLPGAAVDAYLDLVDAD